MPTSSRRRSAASIGPAPVMATVEAERRKRLPADKLGDAAGVARPPADGARRAQAPRTGVGQGHRKLAKAGVMASNKVIITCAVTGAIHTPSMSPYLPVTADEIAKAAIDAAEAGAAIVHLHARDEQTGKPDQSPEAFARFLPRIKQATKAVDQSDDRRRALHDGARSA